LAHAATASATSSIAGTRGLLADNPRGLCSANEIPEAFIRLEAQISPAELLKAADQLSHTELEQFLKQLLLVTRSAARQACRQTRRICCARSIRAFRPRSTIVTTRGSLVGRRS